MTQLRAITLWEPWASLIASGVKTIETRSWATKYRGPLAIHAAARPVREKLVLGDYEAWPADTKDRPHPNHPGGRPARLYCNKGPWLSAATWRPLTFGAVVATADLVDCLPMVNIGEETAITRLEIGTWGGDPNLMICGPQPDGDDIDPSDFYERDVTDQLPYGDFTPGRWAWLLENVRPVALPIPARGRQQLWTWTDPRVSASDV